MLKKIILIAALAALSGCAYATKAPVTGFIYTDVTSGESISANQAGNRVGEACATSILGIVGTGDASIETARRNGGITMITSVDSRAEQILMVYAKHCTIVRGR